ncbi:MAG: hypothetical protein BroJett040_03100 [Oligoflexia bacterium]|nr:MAG: hypothetical protein BroJett040_03100 [Oligoflexia bacterium]
MSFDQALLCGEKIPNSSLKNLLIETSLYHIVVVSSAHLLFLKSTLEHTGLRFIPRFLRPAVLSILLTGYGLMTSLEAPILRALVAEMLSLGANRFKLNWKPHQIILFSVIICLGIHPKLIQSLSLQLSMMTAMGLSIEFQIENSSKKVFLQAFVLYLLLFPLLALIFTPHPVGIFFNAFLAPFISNILLPFSIISTFHEWFRLFYIQFLDLFLITLRSLSPGSVSKIVSDPYPYHLTWVYCLFCWSVLSASFTIKKRYFE